MAIGPLAVDMYLPAMPTLQREFAVDASRVQHTLSAYLLGLAIGQLGFGPIADRFGRKAPLVGGLVIFALASAGCVVAGSIGQFVLLRFAQALGGASGMVVIRAVIRDRFDEMQSARVLSLMMLVMGAAPRVEPAALNVELSGCFPALGDAVSRAVGPIGSPPLQVMVSFGIALG